MIQTRSDISDTRIVSRIERGWVWLNKHPGHRDWDERYTRWLAWTRSIELDALRPDVRTIVASLDPAFVLPQSEHLITSRGPCPYCNAMVWNGAARHPGSKQGDGSPLLLNERPSAWGRWVVEGPGVAVFCAGIAMIDWPLPRYTSHLVDCPSLIQARERQQEERAEQMRWGKERQTAQWAQKKERRDQFFARFEESS